MRTFNSHDIARIRGFLELATEGGSSRYRSLLDLKRGLAEAETVLPQEMPPDVVTMNSEVRIESFSPESTSVVKLVFPQEADYTQGKISLLAPLGAAMLGHRKGDTVRYTAPGGEVQVRINDIVYQPERAGDFES